jgi:hypothetical protein
VGSVAYQQTRGPSAIKAGGGSNAGAQLFFWKTNSLQPILPPTVFIFF